MYKSWILLLVLITSMINFACDSSITPDDQEEKYTGDTTGTVLDIDGNEYKTVRIGNQWWMVENLRTERYQNGDSIRHEPDDDLWNALEEGAYSIYDHAGLNIITYGFLYNWYAVDDARNIAPEGWHVATEDDWQELESFLGMNQSDLTQYSWRGTNQGSMLKQTGTLHWIGPNADATDDYDFNATPAGYRSQYGFNGLKHQTYWWTSTEFQGNDDTYG